jgi:hypothetical protein
MSPFPENFTRLYHGEKFLRAKSVEAIEAADDLAMHAGVIASTMDLIERGHGASLAGWGLPAGLQQARSIAPKFSPSAKSRHAALHRSNTFGARRRDALEARLYGPRRTQKYWRPGARRSSDAGSPLEQRAWRRKKPESPPPPLLSTRGHGAYAAGMFRTGPDFSGRWPSSRQNMRSATTRRASGGGRGGNSAISGYGRFRRRR